MDLLVNLDAPDLARAEAMYVDAFGLTVGRRFGDAVVELLGLPVRLYGLHKAAGSLGVGDAPRDCDGATGLTTSARRPSGRWDPFSRGA